MKILCGTKGPFKILGESSKYEIIVINIEEEKIPIEEFKEIFQRNGLDSNKVIKEINEKLAGNDSEDKGKEKESNDMFTPEFEEELRKIRWNIEKLNRKNEVDDEEVNLGSGGEVKKPINTEGFEADSKSESSKTIESLESEPESEYENETMALNNIIKCSEFKGGLNDNPRD